VRNQRIKSELGGAVQVASIKPRVESTPDSSA
jgi:hypothetical protein